MVQLLSFLHSDEYGLQDQSVLWFFATMLCILIAVRKTDENFYCNRKTG